MLKEGCRQRTIRVVVMRKKQVGENGHQANLSADITNEETRQGAEGEGRKRTSNDVKWKSVTDRQRARNVTKQKARHAGGAFRVVSDTRVLGPVCA